MTDTQPTIGIPFTLINEILTAAGVPDALVKSILIDERGVTITGLTQRQNGEPLHLDSPIGDAPVLWQGTWPLLMEPHDHTHDGLDPHTHDDDSIDVEIPGINE